VSLAQIIKIARREYRARVRNKAFIVMTLLVPAFLGATFSIPILTQGRATNLRLAVLDVGTGLGGALADRLRAIENPHIEVTETSTVTSADASSREQFNTAIRRRTLDGYLVIESDPAAPVRVQYFARETGNPVLIQQLRLAVQSVALGRLLGGIKSDEVQKAQRLDLNIVTVSARDERRGGVGPALASTMALAMLLYMAVLINGQGMATAIVEEKSSRLIEVILGAVTATEFMTGKILGVLGSGLTQLGIWILFAVVAIVEAVPALMIGSGTPGFDLSTILNARVIFYFAVFFSLGYLLYSVLFAVVAVTCTSTEELGQSMMAAVLPMVVALIVALNVIANPSTTMTRVLSLIPFFTPLVMMARVNVLMPPLWEIWLSIALLAASAAAASWAASKIFAYALLMTGKRPNLPELLQVIRAG
jgi:ABC-2 type transport system permease protein